MFAESVTNQVAEQPGLGIEAIEIILLIGAVVAIIAVIIGRALTIYPLSALFSRSRWRINSEHQHIMFWGGLRGALALALALGIPDSVLFRAEILTLTFGVVVFSVFAQGLTMTPLLRKLGQLPDSKVDLVELKDGENLPS